MMAHPGEIGAPQSRLTVQQLHMALDTFVPAIYQLTRTGLSTSMLTLSSVPAAPPRYIQNPSSSTTSPLFPTTSPHTGFFKPQTRLASPSSNPSYPQIAPGLTPSPTKPAHIPPGFWAKLRATSPSQCTPAICPSAGAAPHHPPTAARPCPPWSPPTAASSMSSTPIWPGWGPSSPWHPSTPSEIHCPTMFYLSAGIPPTPIYALPGIATPSSSVSTSGPRTEAGMVGTGTAIAAPPRTSALSTSTRFWSPVLPTPWLSMIFAR